MTAHTDPAAPASDRPAFEITEDMVVAGVAELQERSFGEPLREIAVDVFIAMRAARSA